MSLDALWPALGACLFSILMGVQGCGGEAGGGADTDARQDVSGDAAGDVRTDAVGDATGPVAGRAPTLSGAQANMHGARGLDLRVTVTASDEDKDIDRVRVRLFDGSGAPLVVFRSGVSDTPDTHESALSFDDPRAVGGRASVTASATLRNIFATATPASVEVAVVDARGQSSAFVAATVVAQTVGTLGDGCDPGYASSRCEQGLGCRDGQCREGLAPEITKLAYLNGQGGVRILVSGTEPEDDLESLFIEFLDFQGNSVTIDLDGDEVPESTSFTHSVEGAASGGTFFVRLDPSTEFESQVKQIAVTPGDLADHVGARKTARLTASPVRVTGQGCDPLGFDVCNAASACVLAASGSGHTCRDLNQLRKAECAEAVPLPVDGVPVLGFAAGSSIFDPPGGCAAGDPTGRPEGILRLELTAPASRLVLSTSHPQTGFDTVVYLVAGCGDAGAAPLGCADETGTVAAATLELSDVPAGSYLVVVDSWGPEGGEFAVSATVE